MNRRDFLFKVFAAGAVTISGISLANKVILPTYKHYPMVDEEGNFCKLYPENKAIREESDRMVAAFKTPEEYAAIFKSAHELYLQKNCAEATYRAKIAARRLPKRWAVPKEVGLFSAMLTEYGIIYSDRPNHSKTGCKYKEK